MQFSKKFFKELIIESMFKDFHANKFCLEGPAKEKPVLSLSQFEKIGKKPLKSSGIKLKLEFPNLNKKFLENQIFFPPHIITNFYLLL